MSVKHKINKTIEALRDHDKVLEQCGLGFHLEDFKRDEAKDYGGHICNTVACVAGWVVWANEPKTFKRLPDNAISNAAEKILELSYEQTEDMFLPSLPKGMAWSHCTPEHAIQMLEHFRDTGRVDWGVIK